MRPVLALLASLTLLVPAGLPDAKVEIRDLQHLARLKTVRAFFGTLLDDRNGTGINLGQLSSRVHVDEDEVARFLA